MIDNSKKITRYLFADLILDVQRGELTRDNCHIDLPKLSYDLLVALVASSPALLSQQQLMEKVWPNRIIGDETLKQRIKLLRRALGDDASAPKYIEAVRGRGYRLIPDVSGECVVKHPPSVMLDLSANDHFPSIETSQLQGLWQSVSRGITYLLLLLVLVFTFIYYFIPQSPTSFDPQRVVVLPFKHNLAAHQQHIATAVTESINQQLSKVPAITVLSPSVVSDFAAANQPLIMLAEHFNAGLIIEGRILVQGDEVRITVNLTDSNKQALRWSHEYRGSLSNISTLQQQLSLALVENINSHSTTPLTTSESIPPSAYKFYQRGKEYYQRYHKRDNLIAIDFFNKAIKAFPQYAQAYAALSQAHSQQLFQFGGDEQNKQKAIDNAYLAIAHNNQLAASYQSLGSAYYVSGWLTKSIVAHQKAQILSPENVEILTNLAFINSEQGNFRQALQWHIKALMLKPEHVVSLTHAAITLQRLGQYKLAERYYKKALSLQPDYALAAVHLGVLYNAQGQFDKALAYFSEAVAQEAVNPLLIKGFGDTYLYANQLNEAKRQYDKLRDTTGNQQIKWVKTLSVLLTEPADMQEIIRHIAHYRRLLAAGSDKPEHSYLLALLYIKQQDLANAMRYLVQAIEQGWLLSPQHLTLVLMTPLSENPAYQSMFNLMLSPMTKMNITEETLALFEGIQ